MINNEIQWINSKYLTYKKKWLYFSFVKYKFLTIKNYYCNLVEIFNRSDFYFFHIFSKFS